MGMMDGFKILHDRVSPDYFNLFSGPSAGEFPIQYIVSLTLLGLVGIVVQPHFIVTGGGSAKGEDEARIGLVTGNFLKRLCTMGWAITALIALALLAGNAEIAADPDRVWGVAAREILGPLNLGLVGLMLACLLAAMMSSADAYMLVTSALVSKNIFATYVNPNASEKTFLLVARITGLVIIIGASVFALTMADVFGQFKLALELPILFAAPFWVGMYWRRTNRTAAWITIGFSCLFFLLLPKVIPLFPGVRSHPDFTAMTLQVTTEFTRSATPADVAKRQTWEIHREGVEPPFAVLGEPIQITMVTGGKSIFWQDGVQPLGKASWETVGKHEADGRSILIQRNTAPMTGRGDFRIDFLIYKLLGIDLKNASTATLETLRLPTRMVLPFLVLIIASLFTPRNSPQALDRYYVKMRTEVLPDRLADQSNLEISYQNPHRFAERRLFPNSDFEFVKPRPKDYLGFLAAIAVCVVMVSLLAFLAGIGAC